MCAFCTDDTEATHIMELFVSERAPSASSGRSNSRGARVGSVTRRVCLRHAEGILNTTRRDPRTRATTST